MSRIGRMPVAIPDKVQVNVKGRQVTIKGPKGALTYDFHPDMQIKIEDDALKVYRPTDQRHHKSLHGLTRSLLNNMVIGVVEGFQKQLEVHGVGYRVELQPDRSLLLQLGFSHDVRITPPEGITFEVDERAKLITITGVDKELVGRVAADIRAWRPPEPYKGKGIRYVGEYVRRKAGKAGKI